jgi:excisionase family DNA binding protein
VWLLFSGVGTLLYNLLAMVTRSRSDFTIEEAQKAMGLTPAQIERLIEEGKIHVVREGWKVWVPRQSILDYLSEVSAVPLKQRKKQ